MFRVSVATAKNEFSRLLRHVKRGERVLITERDRPVALLQPIDASGDDAASGEASLAALHDAGVLLPPAGAPLNVTAFLARTRPTLPKSRSLVAAVLAEREEGR